nr:cellulase family glycosylhydrolase [uncultured Carboxylicivirga sp.]
MKITTLIVLFYLSTIYVAAQTPVEKNGQLSVSGNRIVNKNGVPVSLAGNSLFWSNTYWGGEKYYNAEVVDWLASDWNCSIVRAAMGVDDDWGYLHDATNKQKVTTVVDAAIDAGIYVIIDWHSHHAEDYQQQAESFFEEMAQLYGAYPNIIYEIYNEPLQGISWSNSIKPYAEAVIGAIRSYDTNNLIVVGTPSWSQEVDVASNDPITSYGNIAYALHFYAASHHQEIRDKALTALNNGIALMVTEWGTVQSSGDGAVDEAEVDTWMNFLYEHKLSHCNWAMNDKAEGASALKQGASVAGNWTDDNLTTSGLLVKDIVSNWNSRFSTSVSQPDVSTFKMYPNPAKNWITIEASGIKQIELIDIAGNKVKQLNGAGNQTQIDLHTFAKGVYLVKVSCVNQVVLKKLVVQ